MRKSLYLSHVAPSSSLSSWLALYRYTIRTIVAVTVVVVFICISQEDSKCVALEQLRRGGGGGTGTGTGRMQSSDSDGSEARIPEPKSDTKSKAATVASSSSASSPMTTTLHNGIELPLIGLGVGNLQPDLIVSQIVEAMKYGTRLIDTAHSSRNEHLVHQGIVEGLARVQQQQHDDKETTEKEPIVMHVVTKIWYTYLGYARTTMAVRDILDQFGHHPQIRVHILLHWPRCRDDIPWMDCAKEEAQDVPVTVQQSGDPIPHLHKDTAYKESWRALEDIYLGEVTVRDYLSSPNDEEEDNNKNPHKKTQDGLLPKPASIGVSNFDIADLQGLHTAEHNNQQGLRVVPHILQGNVWSYLHDRPLLQYCTDQMIHFQAYNVMQGLFPPNSHEVSPKAYAALSTRALQHKMYPHQLVLKWFTALVTPPVSIIPRTTSLEHVRENSERVLSSLLLRTASASSSEEDEDNDGTLLTDDDLETIQLCVTVLLDKTDLEQPLALFHNTHTDNTTVIHIYWSKNDGSGEEFLVSGADGVAPGEHFETRTYPGHTFVAYDTKKQEEDPTRTTTTTATKKEVYTVSANYGQKEDLYVEL